MFVNFSEETRKIIEGAKLEMQVLNHPLVGSEHLLLSMLKYNDNLIDIFKKQNIDYDKVKNKLLDLVGKGSKKSDFILYTPFLKKVLSNSIIDAREENQRLVTPERLLLLIVNEETGVAYSVLCKLKINIDKLISDVKKNSRTYRFRKKKLLIEELGDDLTKKAKQKLLDPVLGRSKEIENIIEILIRRKKSNPVLTGPAGVGKTAIVEGLANLIIQNKVPDYLKNKRIISLNIFSLVAGTKYRGEFEEKMKVLIRELEENKNIILFIDEIHTIVGAGGAEGAIDASNIFKPALARGELKVIGATTDDEYKKFIEKDSALSRRFQKVRIVEPDKKTLKKILTDIKGLYEKHHNVIFPNEMIDELINLSNKYLVNRYEPDKSIDIMDEVCAYVSLKQTYDEKKFFLMNKKLSILSRKKENCIANKDFKKAIIYKKEESELRSQINNKIINKKQVGLKDIVKIVQNKNGGILLNDMDEKDINKLKLDLNKEVVMEENNINKLVWYLKRKSIMNFNKSFSILLTGPKLSGKRHFANQVAKALNYKNIIHLDFKEINGPYAVNKIIGSINYDNNSLLSKINSCFSSIIIIENLKEAPLEIYDMIENIIRKNELEDIYGKKVSFKNSILLFIEDTNTNQNLGFNRNHSNVSDNIFDLIDNKLIFEKPSTNKIKKISEIKMKKAFSKYNVKAYDFKDKLEEKINDIKTIKDIDKTIYKLLEEYLIQN